MAYLLPARSAVRNRKLGFLGVRPLTNGEGRRPGGGLRRRRNGGVPCEYPAPPTGYHWVTSPTLADPCAATLVPIALVTPPPTPPPITTPPAPTATTGTPVPSGFPTNEFFVASDGSVWEYSSSAGQWINVGVPYNVGAPAAAAAAAAAAPVPAAAPAPTVVTTAPPTKSNWQDLLNWLQGKTLISGVPNWLLALGGGVLLIRVANRGGGRR